MAELSICECTNLDLERVVALWSSAGLIKPWNDPAADFLRAISRPHSAVLAGKDRKKIISSVMVGEDGHRGWLYYLSVTPKFQRMGYGRLMIEAAENWLQNRNCPGCR